MLHRHDLDLDRGRHADTSHKPNRQSCERAIRSVARLVEDDERAVEAWYYGDPIEPLDGLTAAELVARKRSAQVLWFLMSLVLAEEAASAPTR